MSLCFPAPPPPAEQPSSRSWQGNTSSGAPRERCAPRQQTHPERKHAVHTTHTGTDSPALGAHVGILGGGYAVIPNTHTHTHMLIQACAQTGRPQPSSSRPPSQCSCTRAHTDRCIWGYMDTHRPAHACRQPTLHQLRVGAALQPIWSPDPAGLSWSLAVGWSWGICPRG